LGVYVNTPAAVKLTAPLAPWVTAVTARPGSSKLSALAPLVPVTALKLTAVFWLVATASATMSATGAMVMATGSLSLRAPSLVTRVSVAAPL
jgi:hypothetical protein